MYAVINNPSCAMTRDAFEEYAESLKLLRNKYNKSTGTLISDLVSNTKLPISDKNILTIKFKALVPGKALLSFGTVRVEKGNIIKKLDVYDTSAKYISVI